MSITNKIKLIVNVFFLLSLSIYAQKKDSIVYNKEYFAVYRFDEYENKYIETPISTRSKIIGEFDSLYKVEKNGNKKYYTRKSLDIHLHGKYDILDIEKPTYDVPFYASSKNHNFGDNLVTTHFDIIEPITNSKGYFNKGFKIGKWTIYFGGWFAKIEEHYSNGIRDGLYTVYNKNDKVLYQTEFINGTGIEKIYRGDGSLYHIKHFKNGSLDYSKPFELYHKKALLSKTDYVKNLVTKYYRDGEVYETQQIVIENDKIHKQGFHNNYDKQGQLRQKKYYKCDKLIYTINYDTKEKIQKIESGNMIQYFKKGKIKKIEFSN